MSKLFNKILDRMIPNAMLMADMTVWYFIAGMVYIHLRATFLPYEQLIWDDIYYIWNDGLFLLLFILVRCFVPSGYRASLNVVIFYSLIRFLWEIASPFTNHWENNHQLTVTILFSILTIGGIILLWKDLKHRIKQEI